MTGVSEILVLVLLIAGILVLPGLFRRQPVSQKNKPSVFQKLSGLTLKTRAALFIGVAYPATVFIILKPWQAAPERFVLLGIGPVILILAFIWILKGKNNQ